MSKSSHPYFIANDPDRRTTATLLVGTADEFGIDQHDIQMTNGGFNVTKAVAEALGYDVSDDAEDEAPETTEPPEPIVTGTEVGGDATTAVPRTEEGDADAEPAEEHLTTEDADAEPDYADWDYSDLKAEVGRRNLDTEDNKGATYIAALRADDAAQADDGDDDTL